MRCEHEAKASCGSNPMFDAVRLRVEPFDKLRAGYGAPDLGAGFETEDLEDVRGDVGAGDLPGAAGLAVLFSVDYSRILT